jgi:hypothetical protein
MFILAFRGEIFDIDSVEDQKQMSKCESARGGEARVVYSNRVSVANVAWYPPMILFHNLIGVEMLGRKECTAALFKRTAHPSSKSDQIFIFSHNIM